MDKINIQSLFAAGLLYVCKQILKVFPGSTIAVKTSGWARLHYFLNQDSEKVIKADYYNDSEIDIVNIFRELKYLANDGHYYHGDYLLKRLNFLVDEGLNITDTTRFAEYRKLDTDEINKIMLDSKPKVKSGKKIKRDKKGKFVSKK